MLQSLLAQPDLSHLVPKLTDGPPCEFDSEEPDAFVFSSRLCLGIPITPDALVLETIQPFAVVGKQWTIQPIPNKDRAHAV